MLITDKLNVTKRILTGFIKTNEQKIALVIGFALTAALFYGLGRGAASLTPPKITIEEPAIDLTKLNNSLNIAGSQSETTGEVAGANTDDLNCEGKIKGNISSSSKIYHMPGGAFYERTVPEVCFDTESAAADAGFRKSQR